MTTKTPSSISVRRFLTCLATLALFAVTAGCTTQGDNLGNAGNGGDLPATAGAGGGGTGQDCTTPHSGCVCSTEGAHLECGKVVAKSGGQTQCGKGFSVCTGGKWAECIIDNATFASVDTPSNPEPLWTPHGSAVEGLGGPTTCSANPCDPYCVNYPDTPVGLVDAGVNLQPVDGGLMTIPDAGVLPCTPKTCASFGASCGTVGNGCGATLNCGTCPVGQTCGGGGTPFICGTPTPPCVPATCASLGKNCGTVGDLCGGSTASCGVCNGETSPATGTQICGGAGTPNVCGTPPFVCKPKKCSDFGFNCGAGESDGCGGTLNCGTCPVGQACGAGAVPKPGVCGVPTPPGGFCQPTTCAAQGANCGPMADGCGKLLNCGNTCPAGQSCGFGGVPNKCSSTNPPCVPRTCQSAGGKNCGKIGDNCGGTLDCGATCAAGQQCGATVPNVCGLSATCTNFCPQIPTTCGPSGTTSISGKVYAPGNGAGVGDPLPNVVVYVPNGGMSPPYGVTAFNAGVSCDNCAVASGSPLVATTTATDGSFTLKGMPAGTNIPIVIQVGRWRRMVVIPSVAPCVNTPLAASATRFLRNQGEYQYAADNIPHIALSTGCVDGMECVLRKIGISDSEFTNPNGAGRVHFFAGAYCPGAYIGSCNNNGAGPSVSSPSGTASDPACANGHWGGPGATPWETALVSNPGVLDDYDMILFPCQGGEFWYTGNGVHPAYETNLSNYLNAGGRVFSTHFSYNWLTTGNGKGGAGPFSSPLAPAVNWNINQGSPFPDPQTGFINTSFAKGLTLANWLQTIGASTTVGQIKINTLRRDFNSVNAPTQEWMTVNSPSAGINLHFTFNTPLGAPPASQCGRVVYSDLHVENSNSTQAAFPAECNNGAMTPQEKMLEFMLFDLASCVTPDGPPPCIPGDCTSLGLCGNGLSDGCGGTLSCSCVSPQTCGGGGTPGVCGSPYTCAPKSCIDQGLDCGPAGDGCGNTIACPNCPAGLTCGGGGVQGKCGAPPACVPLTCGYWTSMGYNCGTFSDGCGGTTPPCGTCTLPQTCGGGGQPGVCGLGTCTKTTCSAQNITCGPAGDGCGGVIASCGVCPVGQSCGGGGMPGHCGAPNMCVPKSCAAQNLACGSASDGCGTPLSCGTCQSPDTCGGAAMPGQCGHVTIYGDSFFVRDYTADCPTGTAPQWNFWSWTVNTPKDSHVDFSVQTAMTAAGLPTAPMDALLFSNGPVALNGQPTSAHAANQPPGTPDTELGSADVDHTLMVNNRPRANSYLRVTSHLFPSSDILAAPTFDAWDMQLSCIPSE